MAKLHKVKVKSAILRYAHPEHGGRMYARHGDVVELTEEDFKRYKDTGALYTDAEAKAAAKGADDSGSKPSPKTNNDPYDELSIPDAIKFIDDLDEAERADYFERERKIERKGVLTHFDQPLWEGADDSGS